LRDFNGHAAQQLKLQDWFTLRHADEAVGFDSHAPL